MRPYQMIRMMVVVCSMVAGSAFAKDWHKVAELNAGGDAKEIAVSRTISAIRVVAEAGTVTINTVVVREGTKHTPYTVASRLALKTGHDIALPSKTAITGLRISDAGRGTYTVYVK